jgi:hypothetical protein
MDQDNAGDHHSFTAGAKNNRTDTDSKHVLPLALAVFLTLFLIYSSIAAHYPQHSDGGELAVAAVTHGLIHPPGYPLYALISVELVALWPDNPFYTLAIFSAFAQAAAAGLLLYILRFFSVPPLLGALTAFCWGIHFFTLITAYDTELFAFHNVLSAVLVLICQWSLVTRRSPLTISLTIGVATGVCIAHHHMLVLWFPLLGVVLCHQAQRLGGLLHLLRSGCIAGVVAVLTALPFYLTLFASYLRDIEETPDTLVSLVHLGVYFFRIRYGTFSLGIDLSPTASSAIFDFLKKCLFDFPVIAAALVMLPYVTIRDKSLVAWGLFFSLLAHLWFVVRIPVELGVVDQWSARFLSTPMYAVIICTAIALSSFSRGYFTPLLLCITAVAITRQLIAHSPAIDVHSADTLWATAEKRLEPLESGGVVLIDDDFYHFRSDYFQRVQGRRPDLIRVIKPFLGSQKYRSVVAAKIDGWSFNASCIAQKTAPCRLISLPEIFDLLRRICQQGRVVVLSQKSAPTASCEATVEGWRNDF